MEGSGDSVVVTEGSGDGAAAPLHRRRKEFFSWGPGWKTLSWCGVVFVYLLLGGLIFTLAERQNEIDAVDAAVAQREELQQLLEERKADAIATLAANNCNTTTPEAALETIERVINVSFSLALASQELQAETSPLWTYSPSVFFSATVITTIGVCNNISHAISHQYYMARGTEKHIET